MPHAIASALKASKCMHRGYYSPAALIKRETHDPAQWREQTTCVEYQDEMPIQLVCGWRARKFLSDLEDKKR